MVRGLDALREHLRDHVESYAIIGGVACEVWLTSQNLTFRATRDVDVVLLVEGRTSAFLERLLAFIDAHGYSAHTKKDGTRTFYRFFDPDSDDVPSMIELFSILEAGMETAEGQRVIPIAVDGEFYSLSAILLDDDYYALIRDATDSHSGLPTVSPRALIPLKARAYLDLTQRKAMGEDISTRDIKKHRNDVFLLASTLPATPGAILPEVIKKDLVAFLDKFPEDSDDWNAIRSSAETTLGSRVPQPAALRGVIQNYFRL